MPFNISNPVLFYNKKMFAAAGLDPEKPPVSLDELRADSEAIVSSGAAKYGLALDSGFDSGGGWYSSSGSPRPASSTPTIRTGARRGPRRCCTTIATGQSLLAVLQSMISDGLAFNVGDNAGGFDHLLKLADIGRAGGDDDRHVCGDRRRPHRAGQRPVPADHRRRSRNRGDARTRWQARSARRRCVAVRRRHRRRRADRGRVGTSSPISPRRSSRASGRRRPVTCRCAPTRSTLEPLQTTLTTDPRFKVALRPTAVGTRRTDIARSRSSDHLREVRTVTAQGVAAIFGGADVAAWPVLAAARSPTQPHDAWMSRRLQLPQRLTRPAGRGRR